MSEIEFPSIRSNVVTFLANRTTITLHDIFPNKEFRYLFSKRIIQHANK